MRGIQDRTPRERFIASVLGGATVAAGARAAGVAPQVVYTWARRGDAEVRAAIEAARARRPRSGPSGAPSDAPQGPDAQAPGPNAASGSGGPSGGDPAADLRRAAVERLMKVLADDAIPARDHVAAAVAVGKLLGPNRPAPVAAPPATPATGSAADETGDSEARLRVLQGRVAEFLGGAREAGA